MTYVAFSIKFAKTNQKFAENSEFCATYSHYSKLFTGVLKPHPVQARRGADVAQHVREGLLRGEVAPPGIDVLAKQRYLHVPVRDERLDLRADRVARARPKLKSSIGEGSNHSNFSDQSSVRIQEILLEFIRN